MNLNDWLAFFILDWRSVLPYFFVASYSYLAFLSLAALLNRAQSIGRSVRAASLSVGISGACLLKSFSKCLTHLF